MDASESVDLVLFILLSPLVLSMYRRVRLPRRRTFLIAYVLMFGFYLATALEHAQGMGPIDLAERACLAAAGVVFSVGLWQLASDLRESKGAVL